MEPTHFHIGTVPGVAVESTVYKSICKSSKPGQREPRISGRQETRIMVVVVLDRVSHPKRARSVRNPRSSAQREVVRDGSRRIARVVPGPSRIRLLGDGAVSRRSAGQRKGKDAPCPESGSRLDRGRASLIRTLRSGSLLAVVHVSSSPPSKSSSPRLACERYVGVDSPYRRVFWW